MVRSQAGTGCERVSLAPAPAPYEVRNRGPWTTVEFDCWPDFSVGQTTALTGGAGANFRASEVSELLMGAFLNEDYHQPEQVHDRKVRAINRNPSCYRGTDGLFSSRPGQALTILTADCLPVFLKSANNTGWALVHAGWRGACAGIVPATVENYFDASEPLDVLTGAGISPETYEVGEEVVEAAADSPGVDSRDELFDLDVVVSRDSRYHLDLERLVGLQLRRLACEINSFRRLPFTTDGESELPFFSHRQDRTEQRALHWIFKK